MRARRSPYANRLKGKQRTRAIQASEYLTVDLDIFARRDLRPLVEALGDNVLVHFVGRRGGGRVAILGLAGPTESPTDAIIRCSRVIDRLPVGARLLWKQALRRIFNVGIQAGDDRGTFELAIENKALSAAARHRAEIVVTVYGSGVR